jgi:hypothetical protein
MRLALRESGDVCRRLRSTPFGTGFAQRPRSSLRQRPSGTVPGRRDNSGVIIRFRFQEQKTAPLDRRERRGRRSRTILLRAVRLISDLHRVRSFNFFRLLSHIELDSNLESDLFFCHGEFQKTELLPIRRPRCPACSMSMLTVDIQPRPEGFEHRTFECLKCGHFEKTIACGPTLPWHRFRILRS